LDSTEKKRWELCVGVRSVWSMVRVSMRGKLRVKVMASVWSRVSVTIRVWSRVSVWSRMSVSMRGKSRVKVMASV
jgi:hypothetical protein